MLKSTKDLVDSALKDGLNTVVAVGNDLTVSKVAAALAGKRQDITLGLIPIGEENQSIARLLGIPIGVLACHVLSSRIVELIDLGRVNNQYFLRSVTVSGTPMVVCDERFKLAINHPHTIKVCNLDTWEQGDKLWVANPKNHLLETVLTPLPQRNWFGLTRQRLTPSSQVMLESCTITSPGHSLPVIVDGDRVLKTPVTVRVATQRLRVIVGKKRLI